MPLTDHSLSSASPEASSTTTTTWLTSTLEARIDGSVPSAKDRLMNLTRRQKRTLESWFQENPRPSRFSKVVLIESFGGNEDQVGAIHLWFIIRRKIATRRQRVSPVLLAPIPNPVLQASPFLRPPARSPTLYRLEDRRAPNVRKYSDSLDVAHQLRRFTLGPSPPLLVAMDSDCSPMDDRLMADVEPFEMTASKIRRKSVNKVKEWMQEAGQPPLSSPEGDPGHLWPGRYFNVKSTASSYDEGYHSRSSVDVRHSEGDHSRSPSGLSHGLRRMSFASMGKSDRSDFHSPQALELPLSGWEWNSNNSYVFEPSHRDVSPMRTDSGLCLFPQDSIPRIQMESDICPVTLVGAEPNVVLEEKPRRPSDDSQMPLSNAATEDFEDGELSMWTEENQKAVDVSKYVSLETRKWFHDRLIYAFAQSRVERVAILTAHGDYPYAAGDHGSIICDSAVPSSSDNPRNPLKRRRKSKEDEEDKNGPHRSPPAQNNSACMAQEDDGSRLLACPFCKWKPLTYRSCQGMVLREISRVKQHLWRNHQVPIHCVICFTEFPTEADRDEHLRQRNCSLQQAKQWEGVTVEQKAALRRRVDPTKSRREQWNGIFQILFPGHPLPESPYTERLLSAELVALQDYIVQEWPSVFDRLVETRLPTELQSQEAVVRAFSASVFEDAVGTILERFGATREGSVSPDSGYASRQVPVPPRIEVRPPSMGGNNSEYTVHAGPSGTTPRLSELGHEYFISDDLLFDWNNTTWGATS
ncbi:hypothetical protein VHEMI01878 [[Torrubiella] hemipterigena]|nr:hypothetical protein VHEMI01878 [[Torrubiella] hemipterigena]